MDNGLVISTDVSFKELGKQSQSKRWKNGYALFSINNVDYWLQFTQPANKWGIVDNIFKATLKPGVLFRAILLVKQSKNKSTKIVVRSIAKIG